MIVRKSIPYAATTAVAAVLVAGLQGPEWSAPLWALVGLILYLFRDPARAVPAVALGVVSPADGRVVEVQSCHDARLDQPCVRVSIRVGLTSALTIRSPVEAKVTDMWREPDQNEHGEAANRVCHGTGFGFSLQTDERDRLRLSMRGFGPFRPRCGARVGERVGQGQRCGRLPIGSCVEVWLPDRVRVQVEPGRPVRAGSDLLATLVHPTVSVNG